MQLAFSRVDLTSLRVPIKRRWAGNLNARDKDIGEEEAKLEKATEAVKLDAKDDAKEKRSAKLEDFFMGAQVHKRST